MDVLSVRYDTSDGIFEIIALILLSQEMLWPLCGLLWVSYFFAVLWKTLTAYALLLSLFVESEQAQISTLLSTQSRGQEILLTCSNNLYVNQSRQKKKSTKNVIMYKPISHKHAQHVRQSELAAP